MVVLLSYANGQSDDKLYNHSQNSQITLAFDQKDFNERFSVFYSSEGDYDYYVIDLTQLGGRFERIYFMNLTYSDSRIVNLDADLEKEQTWFKAYHKYTETEIECLFNDLKEETKQDSQKMTDEEKSAWMVKFDKFKKSTENE